MAKDFLFPLDNFTCIEAGGMKLTLTVNHNDANAEGLTATKHYFVGV